MPRRLTAILVALVWALLLPALVGADPIPGATYKGTSSGDGHGRKVELNVSEDGKLIGNLTIGFDSQCVQNGNHYQNKRVSMVFYRVRIKRDGTFQDRQRRRYRGGRDVYRTGGHFSGNGTRVRGRFSYRGRFSGGGVDPVHCHAKGHFTAHSKGRF